MKGLLLRVSIDRADGLVDAATDMGALPHRL
jgi:hypothetical protein